jgi:hypothetical protein
MAHFDINDATQVSDSFLNYKHPSVTLFNKGQWTTVSTGVLTTNYCYKITYPLDNKTKLSYLINGNPTSYQPTYMYIYGLIHNNILGLTEEDPDTKEYDKDIIGELVIEYVSNVTSGKIFLCILLKKSSTSVTTETSIDKIMNMIINKSDSTKSDYVTSVDINLGLDIPASTNQKCFVYDDNINKVIVLTEPIILKDEPLSKIIAGLEKSTDLFKISAPNNYQNNVDTEGSPMISDDNMDDNEKIYIDCKPTGAGTEEISIYQLPIGSKLSTDLQNMDFMKTSVNFFVFIFGLIFTYFTVPLTYKMLVVTNVNKLFPDSTTSNNEVRVKRIRSVDILLSIAFITAAISCFITGFNVDNQFLMVTNGLFLLTFFALSLSIIQFSKTSDEFMSNGSTKTSYSSAVIINFFDQIKDFGYLIGECFGYVIEPNTAAGRPIIAIIAAELIFLFILGTIKEATSLLEKGDFEKYLWQIGGLCIPIGIPLFIYMLSP